MIHCGVSFIGNHAVSSSLASARFSSDALHVLFVYEKVKGVCQATMDVSAKRYLKVRVVLSFPLYVLDYPIS